MPYSKSTVLKKFNNKLPNPLPNYSPIQFLEFQKDFNWTDLIFHFRNYVYWCYFRIPSLFSLYSTQRNSAVIKKLIIISLIIWQIHTLPTNYYIITNKLLNRLPSQNVPRFRFWSSRRVSIEPISVSISVIIILFHSTLVVFMMPHPKYGI